MHHVIVPKPITLQNIKTRAVQTDEKGDPVTRSLFDIICDVAFNDKIQFGAGWKASVALNAIHEKFSSAKFGDIVSLEDDHYERLNTSLLMLTAETDKDTGFRYDPKLLFQVLPLLRSIKEAMTDEEYKEYLKKKDESPAVDPAN